MGRDLLKNCKTLLQETEYYEIIFPKPKTEKDREWDKIVKRVYENDAPRIAKQLEYFFNEVIPHTEFAEDFKR